MFESLFNQLVEIFNSSQSRLFWGYWLTGGLIALLWSCLAWSSRKGVFVRFVSMDYWFGRSSFQDMRVIALNQVLFLLLGVSWGLWVLAVSISVYEGVSFIYPPTFLEQGGELTFSFSGVFNPFVFNG